MIGALLVIAAGCGGTAPPAVEPTDEPTDERTFLELRASLHTRLRREAPLVERWPDDPPPEGFTRVEYRSGDLTLFGWYAEPEDETPLPAVVYLHGAYFLKAADVPPLRRFVEAGYAVFLPALRGRNGNPGHHELLLGEVSDAMAAIDWVAARDGIDRDRIYLVGHSLGGATAALVAMHPDVPVALTASVGGIYAERTFRYWKRRGGADGNLVRFDVDDPDEIAARIIGRHAAELAHPHVAYVGEEESAVRRNAAAVADAARPGTFEIEIVPGGHMSALDGALERFLHRIEEDR